MPSGIDTPPPLPETPVTPPPSESEVVIQQRIKQAGQQVKWVEIADGLIVLAIGVLVYFLAVAVIDHWMVVGGLGFWGRFGLWLMLVGVAGAFFVVRLLPLLVYRINPLWAAATIEQSRPSLKNGLINFLLLRHRRREVAPVVYRAMERQAATDLMEVELDVAVDRAGVIRLGFVLAGVLAVFCLYLVVSPKNPIRSAARVLWPWSSVEAPTRVSIRDVQPGNTTAFYGDFVAVTAEVSGLDDDEQVLVIYSTADGQTVDQTVPMTLPAGDYRYEGLLPPDKQGIQQDLTYRLAAGDFRSRPYRIEALVAPAIMVEKVLYHYPRYTGMVDRIVEQQGDLRAIEGTEVTIHAVANAEIKPGTAEIDTGCTGRQGLRMTTDDRMAVGHFFLRLNPKDRSKAEFDSYQLRFADLHGRENVRPIRHRIEVIRDLLPEAQLIEPKREEVHVAVDGKLAVKVRAEDPDFGLRRVRLRAQRNKENLPITPLLDQKKPKRAWPGEFTATYEFEPRRLGLKVGDRVAYWVEAEDNREPSPGVGVSGKQWFVVVGREGRQEDRHEGEDAKDDQSTSEGRADEATNENQSGEAANGDQAGEQTANDRQEEGDTEENQTGKNGSQDQTGDEGDQAGQDGDEKSKERIDPDAAPGDAMQEILNDRREEQEKQQQEGEPSESDGQDSEEKQSGEKSQDGEKDGEESEEEQGRAGESSEEKPAGETGSDGMAGEKGGKGEEPDEKGEAEQGRAGESGESQAGGEKGGSENADQESAKEGAETEQGKSGDSGSEKNSEAKGGSEKTDENGVKEKGAGEEGEAEQGRAGESGEDQPGETAGDRGRPDTKPGAGKDVGNEAGSPEPLDENQALDKKPGRAGEAPGEPEGDKAQSPSTSKKPSDSQGETAGDRSGGGQEGGGQQADQPGVGGPGSHRPADEGGSQADEPGEGEDGIKAGDQSAAKKPTGSTEKTRTDDAASTEQGDTASSEQGETTGKETTGKTQSGKQPGETESGVPTGGGKPGTNQDGSPPPETVDPRADKANLEYARRQSALALEHLREQLAKEKPELLERLGWSKDDARRFLKRWESIRRAAAEEGPAGVRAQEQYKNALQSLGLRPGGTELRHGGLDVDRTQKLRDAGRFAPPPEWAEQFREYTRGVAGGKNSDE